MIYVIAPTFKEPEHVKKFIQCWVDTARDDILLVICNASPGDETSDHIAGLRPHQNVVEIAGNPNLYWAGLVGLGVDYVTSVGTQSDVVVFANVDITFDKNILDCFPKASELGRLQLGAMVKSTQGVYLSCGVKVMSWFLSLNRHPYRGLTQPPSTKCPMTEVSFLPTRFTMVPMEALQIAGRPDEIRLPHYGADYEFSNRMRLSGFTPHINLNSCVVVDELNTGSTLENRPKSLLWRFRSLTSIKSPFNLRYRTNFVARVYPIWCVPSALLLNYCKIIYWLLWDNNSKSDS